jgi:hypothetical protein
MRIGRHAAVVFAALIAAGGAQAAIHDTVHRTFNVADGGTLTLEADLGDVTITTGGTGVAVDIARDVRANSHADADAILRDLDLSFDQQGNDVRVRSKYRDHESHWFHWRTPLQLRYSIRVPSRYNLEVATAGGDLEVGDIVGLVDCRTSGGDVKLGRVNGSVDARTSGGDVTLRASTGPAKLNTSGGSIEIDEAGASVEAKTSGGSIDIRRTGGGVLARTSGGGITIGEAGGAIDAVTSGGSITATFGQQPQGESRLSTSGGGVTVSLAPAVAVDLDAHTSGGGIDSDVPVTVLGEQSESTLVGKINGGGPKLVVRTSGGGIRVKKM